MNISILPTYRDYVSHKHIRVSRNDNHGNPIEVNKVEFTYEDGTIRQYGQGQWLLKTPPEIKQLSHPFYPGIVFDETGLALY